MVQQQWQQVWVCTGLGGCCCPSSSERQGWQQPRKPTHCAAQLLHARHYWCQLTIYRAKAFCFTESDFQFSTRYLTQRLLHMQNISPVEAQLKKIKVYYIKQQFIPDVTWLYHNSRICLVWWHKNMLSLKAHIDGQAYRLCCVSLNSDKSSTFSWL